MPSPLPVRAGVKNGNQNGEQNIEILQFEKYQNLGHVLVSNLTCGVFIGRTPWRSSTTYPWTEKRRYPKHFSSITQSCPNIPIVDK